MIILNIYVISRTKKYIFDSQRFPTEKKEFAVIPGAGLTKDKKPSVVLSDRLDGALMLYKKGLVNKILVSGDHRGSHYSETEAMISYLENYGIPEDKIYRDDKGFSTFETVYNCKMEFKINSAYFVSQRFHLPRMISSGRKLKMDALGFSCNFHRYSKYKHTKWKLREIPSRVKDFFLATYYILAKKI